LCVEYDGQEKKDEKSLILISHSAVIVYVAFRLEIQAPYKILHKKVISLANKNCLEQTETSEFHISSLRSRCHSMVHIPGTP
jgi:membrane-anchored glycerophosphoryl diester phosphodiesterase (GDPDase)